MEDSQSKKLSLSLASVSVKRKPATRLLLVNDDYFQLQMIKLTLQPVFDQSTSVLCNNGYDALVHVQHLLKSIKDRERNQLKKNM